MKELKAVGWRLKALSWKLKSNREEVVCSEVKE
jgi:hypothetical protein